MPGKHISPIKVALYHAARQQMMQVTQAATLACISVSTASRIDKGSWHQSQTRGDRRKKWLSLWHHICLPHMVANPQTSAR